MERKSGILMHISSLPSPYGIGTLGKEAYKFADFLREAGQTYWQILPIGPTGYGNSPYTSFSTYAGNPYLIDLNMLIEEGILKQSEIDAYDWGKNPEFVDYKKITSQRLKVLKKAYKRFIKTQDDYFDKFIESQAFWLDDYALYMAIINYKFVFMSWNKWPDESIKKRKDFAMKKYTEDLKEEIMFFKFIQYTFFKQWDAFKKYVNSLDIKIIGDIPIYVPLHSSDVWANQNEFMLDAEGKPIRLSGTPPDLFSEDGQLWGHPIYDWSYMKQNDYEWWINRIRALSNLYDVTRIDHFRAFDTYYSIPNDGEEYAVRRGEWVDGPGEQFFNVMKEKVEGVEIIAEDLGSISKSVEMLLHNTGYPGMNVLILSLDTRDEYARAPYIYDKNYVVYTGTHDNDTVIGWLNELSRQEFDYVLKYCTLTKQEGYNWGLIRTVYSSVCELAIVPMQDVLGLGTEARMNTPSYIGDNWCWRIKPDIETEGFAKRLSELCELYGRKREDTVDVAPSVQFTAPELPETPPSEVLNS